jgi:uncharacterized repeat protein (TIGR02543 family)
MFINRAWITVKGVTVPTNNVYHQGAGIALVTFSTGFGGRIYNAAEQVLDYNASPYAGVVVVPDEGYCFAGWSHAAYRSLRGETIRAQSGVMLYDTLTVYGDVALRAEFELETYPIVYHLYEGVNESHNPLTYTIETSTIVLGAPEKAGDEFVGWTGSNGDEPQLTVTIPQGSMGERVYHANYLRSGSSGSSGSRITGIQPLKNEADNIWAANNELYIRTSQAGSIVRIYSTDGILLKLQPILQPGETKIKLPQGLYVVTLNNGLGKKIMMND